MKHKLTLKVLSEMYGVCRLDIEDFIPNWAYESQWFSITRTSNELSIVCEEKLVPDGITCECGWRSFKVEGVLDFGLVGILASISTLMAQNNISIFAISTYDTDYILMKDNQVEKAIELFRNNDYEVINE